MLAARAIQCTRVREANPLEVGTTNNTEEGEAARPHGFAEELPLGKASGDGWGKVGMRETESFSRVEVRGSKRSEQQDHPKIRNTLRL